MTQRYIDRHGRLVDASAALDARGVLKDGFGVHTPLFMMDAVQKSVADAKRRRVTEFDPMGRKRSTFEEEIEEDAALSDAALALHRPGYRTSVGVSDAEAVKA